MNKDSHGEARGETPTRFQKVRGVVSLVFSVPLIWVGIYGLVDPLLRLIDGAPAQQAMVFSALFGVVLLNGGYVSARYALRVLRSSGEATAVAADPQPRSDSVAFRISRAVFSIITLAGAFLLLSSCDISDCHIARVSSDAATMFRIGVISAFALAGLFAARAASGLSLRGLGAAWRAAGSSTQVTLGIALIMAFLVLSSVLDVVFESKGIGAPGKRPGVPLHSAIEQPVVRAS